MNTIPRVRRRRPGWTRARAWLGFMGGAAAVVTAVVTAASAARGGAAAGVTEPESVGAEGVGVGPAFAGAAQEHVPYDGRFTFTRIRYGSATRYGRGWGRSAWAHDYPAADRNMQTMLNEFTAMRATTEGSNVFRLEDPDIFRHPVLYISEPGFWSVTEEGARNLRSYLLKGGFLIFDDFEARQWDNMAAQLSRSLPEGRWHELDASHPVFRAFFHVEDIYVPHPLVRVTPRYMAIFEDNDPSKRIMVLANHNSDLAEYWEYAARGYFPVDPTNDAFRLGINYLVYGVTH